MNSRLGLFHARVPYADRHGILWLERCRLSVVDGCLRATVASNTLGLDAGVYDVPYQNVTCILLGPGSTISHDALRILHRNGTGLVVIGDGCVRHYASLPAGADDSRLARSQMRKWYHEESRVKVARKMYAIRFGEEPWETDLRTLRGIEGSRMKRSYQLMAKRHGIEWKGRRYDRTRPGAADVPNAALNHVVTATYSVAKVAVAATATIPQLGFIHEDSSVAFALDIADLFRVDFTMDVAFAAAREIIDQKSPHVERLARKRAGQEIRKRSMVSKMIDAIKGLLDVDDRGDNA